MTTSETTLTALTFQEFGSRLEHCLTVPGAVEPGESFVQLLRVRRDAGGETFDRPTFLILCLIADTETSYAGLSGFWYRAHGEGPKVEQLLNVVASCELLAVDKWKGRLTSVRPYYIRSDAANLDQLLRLGP
jgi:hypothetical protein